MSNKYELNDEELLNITGGTGGQSKYGFSLGQTVNISVHVANEQWKFLCTGIVTSASFPVKVKGANGVTYNENQPQYKFEA